MKFEISLEGRKGKISTDIFREENITETKVRTWAYRSRPVLSKH